MFIRHSIILLLTLLFPWALYSQVAFEANETAGCAPHGVVISVVSPDAGTISSYLWTINYPDGTVVTSSSPQYIAIFSAPGSYDVSLTINGNQTATEYDYITVFSNPVADFTVNDTEGCFPFSVQFTDNSTPGSAPITEWMWDFGGGQTTTGQNPAFTYNNTGTYTPILSIEDANGCFSSLAQPGLISVQNTFPNAQFTLSNPITCSPPELVNMTNSSTGNSAITSEWSFGDGSTNTTPGAANASHSYSTTGTFDVCLTVTDEIGCENTECHVLTIFDQAVAAFIVSDNTVCSGQSVSFTNQVNPSGAQFQWDFDGNGTIDSNLPNPSYTYANAGTYNPVLTIAYSPTCSDTENGTTITVSAGPNPTFSTASSSACAVPFTTTISSSTSGVITDYTWYINGVEAGNAADLTYTFNAFGTYDVELEVTSADGCVVSLEQPDYITVAAPEVSFDMPNHVCIGMPLDITNVTTNSTEDIVLYEWDFDGDGTADETGANPSFTYSAQGQFPVSVTITTESGCTASFTHPQGIQVLANTNTSITASTTFSCAGQSIEFCITSPNGNQFSWNFNDGSGWFTMDSDEVCITHDYQDTGYFDVNLTVFNGACNSNLVWEDFIYISPPVSIFEFNLDCTDLLSVEFSDLSIEADSLVWDFGDGSPAVINELNPIHEYPATGTYEVTLTAYNDLLGCPDESTVTVVVQAPDPGLVFGTPPACPPAIVDLTSTESNTYWDISISNGDHVMVQFNDDTNLWEVTYTHSGIIEFEEYTLNENFWPDLEFTEAGCYDFTATVMDTFGCTNTVFYDDAICVSSGANFATFTPVILDDCEEVIVTVQADIAGIVSWDWTFSDGYSSTQPIVTHEFLPPYYYNLPVTATLHAVDSQGCESTVTQEIDINLPVIPDFAVIGGVACALEEVQFVNNTTGPATAYSWDFGDPSSGAENTSTLEDPTHIFAQNGTYTVCLTADNGFGCLRTSCENPGVQVSSPVASFTHSSTINNCLYAVSFDNTSTGPVTSISWDFGDGQTGSGDQVFHTYPIGVYDVTMVVTTAAGCSDTATVYDIFNYGNVIGPFSTQLDSANCAPFGVTLEAFNPADTYFSYFWDFNDGYGDPSGSTVSYHEYLSAGSYCPQLIMTDPNGCDVFIPCTNPIVVDEFELLFDIPDALCAGDTISTLITGGESYLWSNPSEVTPGETPGSFLIHPGQSTTLTLTGYYSDCEITYDIPVTVHPLPVVTLSIDTSVCHQDALFGLYGGSPSDIPGTYFVNDTPSLFFDPSWAPELGYEVAYEYTDAHGCVGVAAAEIFIHGLPEITLPVIEDFCFMDPVSQLPSASPANGIYEINSVITDLFDPSTYVGTHEIRYTFTDSFGCTNRDSVDVQVHPLPVPALEFSPICSNETLDIINVSAIESGSITGASWVFGNGTAQDALQPAPLAFDTYGEYSIYVELISNEGCTSELDTTVNVWDVPVAEFTFGSGCQYTSVPFQSNSTIEEGAISEYLWNVEGETLTGDSVAHVFTTWGQVPVSHIVISEHGCSDTISYNLTIYPGPVMGMNFSSNCFGQESVFESASTIEIGGITESMWEFGDGSTEEGTSVDNLYSQEGTYPVTLTVTTNLGCVNSISDSITIYPLPVPAFEVDVNEACAGNAVSFLNLSTINTPSEITSWSWYFDNGLVATESDPVIYHHEPGLYNVTLEVITDHGCAADTTAQQLVQIFPVPVAGFSVGDETLSMAAPMVHITDESSEDVTFWQYHFGDGTYSLFEQGTHLYESWGEYDITQMVENTFGCRDTAYLRVNVVQDLLVYIPNAFTPDGNGHNEFFKPVMSGFVPTHYEFSVFDRWGNIVFKTNDVEGCWNGQHQNVGEMSPDGAYTWQLDIRTEESPVINRMQGMVVLLK